MNAFFILILTLFSAGEKTAESPTTSAEIQEQQEMSTYYFIRHAEKDLSDPENRDPKLSEEGIARAAKWAEILKEVKFDMIFSSNYERTRTTAKAVAESQQKKVQLYDPKKLNDPEFREKTEGKTVLVVGHSNTNPMFVNLLLQEKKYADLSEEDYGSLYIVHLAPDGTTSSELLKIN
ncbi:MAG: phosphoglycerate mutase family protein [Salinimicrobium sp.]